MEFDALYYALPVAAVLLAVGWRPWRGEEAPWSGPILVGLAVPACYIAGWYGWKDAWPTLTPETAATAKEWLLPAVSLAAIGLVAPRFLVLQAWLAWAAADLVVGSGLYRVFAQVEEHRAWIVLAYQGGLALYALNLAALARREGFEVPLIVLIGLVAASLVQREGWASGALLLGAVAFVVGGAMVIGAWRRTWAPLCGAGLAVGIVVGGTLVLGKHTAESSWEASLVAAGIPLLAWIPGKHWLFVILRVLAAGGLAYLAFHWSVPAPNPALDAYYG